ncbi:rhodanese-like domain-containing protein [Gillisia marina]|uniref:rhodanese-like domain-containing protein n=1 Tax=Gillisia marina TaxID=1167637 RepID=UPI001ED94168|nr:rhodanese-like domain-containing protein [Gillisia marina]
MSKLKILIIMGFFTSLFGLKAQTSEHIKVLDVTEFKEHISDKKVVLIDVRTPSEFNDGNIKNSENIDFYDRDFSNCFSNFKKDEPIYVYCHSGGRSNKAAKMLAKLGFTKIYDLKGGYTAWKSQC